MDGGGEKLDRPGVGRNALVGERGPPPPPPMVPPLVITDPPEDRTTWNALPAERVGEVNTAAAGVLLVRVDVVVLLVRVDVVVLLGEDDDEGGGDW